MRRKPGIQEARVCDSKRSCMWFSTEQDVVDTIQHPHGVLIDVIESLRVVSRKAEGVQYLGF